MKKKIAIVDDELVNRETLKMILSKEEDLDLITGESGEDAIRICQEECPDLIFLDVQMNDMDGFTVCENLKKNLKTKNITVIFLSSLTDSKNIIKGFEVGGVDYITKPFKKRILLTRMRTHLNLVENIRKAQEQKLKAEKLIHVLCHDLRNPVGNAISYLSMMEKRPDLFEKYYPTVIRSLENGIDMIDVIKENQSLEENLRKIKLEPNNLKECIDISIELLSAKINEKAIKIIIDVDDSLNVLTERVSFINSVVNNLLTNAIKFSITGGKVLLTAKKCEYGVEFIIQDFGIGIPNEMIEGLFNPLEKSSRAGTSGESGTGFGMPLVKSYIDLYGAKISVESSEAGPDSETSGSSMIILLKSKD